MKNYSTIKMSNEQMRELYNSLPIKPKWLTREQINEYAARMGVK